MPRSPLGGRDPALDGELAAVVESLRQATVQVSDDPRAGGSGIIWRRDGVIVTNAHVARGERTRVTLSDGRTVEGRVHKRDPRRDLAEVRIAMTDLPAVTAGDPTALRPGALVLALGNPLGIVGALAVGVVHAVEPDERGTPGWIRADVRLAPGNSGGPLADARGRIVGVNAMIVGGLGVAIASTVVERFLADSSEAARPTLGVVARPVQARVGGTVTTPGLLVLEIVAGSAAERAGLMPGDIVVGIDARPIQSAGDLGAALERAGFRGALALDLVRGGFVITRRAVLPPAPSPGVRAA